MRSILLLLFVLFSAGVHAQMDLKKAADSASYAIGVKIANAYVKQGMKSINGLIVSRAIDDVLIHTKSKFTEEQADLAIVKITNPQIAKTIQAGRKFLADNKLKPGVQTTTSGLQYKVVTKGGGIKPTLTDTVTAHYTGRLTDGTEFDSSYKRDEPITFDLLKVIRGWTEGLQLMTEGSKYKFYVPYTLAYGIMDRPRIPAGSVLIFDVELIKVVKKLN
ncbi:FKBP-type peptidyl-prolyl cis-trans isomerase [Parapedobacter tibetensis]|uniref:FKBP-type peptidyl-prolyl cis-trans isomerase n=1 Tax=Parapedobacter tibetensis TaxID=2972951 RepID=UPI00214DC5E4|nr:FKBP-type peptidyl-prolyl cis-trans isomerase [Parapedobacter tibetensis]